MSLVSERTATAAEQAFAEWAGDRFRVVAGFAFHEDGSESEATFLVREELIDDRLHGFYCGPYRVSIWPEHWEHLEALLNAGFERYREGVLDDGA